MLHDKPTRRISYESVEYQQQNAELKEKKKTAKWWNTLTSEYHEPRLLLGFGSMRSLTEYLKPRKLNDNFEMPTPLTKINHPRQGRPLPPREGGTRSPDLEDIMVI